MKPTFTSNDCPTGLSEEALKASENPSGFSIKTTFRDLIEVPQNTFTTLPFRQRFSTPSGEEMKEAERENLRGQDYVFKNTSEALSRCRY